MGLAAAAALCAAGCDQLGLGPPQAASEPTPPPAAPVTLAGAELRQAAGASYSDFVAGAGAPYAPDVLGLTAADRARVWRAMASHDGGELVSGGGAEALVFRGCAEGGCGDGAAIVAIDTATGGAFVGVRDVGGADVLAPNDRVEALLRLNSPTRSWEDIEAQQTPVSGAVRP